jgi:hypothetical protein
MSSTTPITLPSPTSTNLGFGMIPIYPSSLLLSDSVLVRKPLLLPSSMFFNKL